MDERGIDKLIERLDWNGQFLTEPEKFCKEAAALIRSLVADNSRNAGLAGQSHREAMEYLARAEKAEAKYKAADDEASRLDVAREKAIARAEKAEAALIKVKIEWAEDANAIEDYNDCVAGYCTMFTAENAEAENALLKQALKAAKGFMYKYADRAEKAIASSEWWERRVGEVQRERDRLLEALVNIILAYDGGYATILATSMKVARAALSNSGGVQNE